VRTLILARHGESAFSVRRLANGDPAAPGPLTEQGQTEARALGEALAPTPIDLCATTRFERTRETADLALAGRTVPRIVVPELDDIRVGEYEGRTVDDYRRWAHGCSPTEACPGGGESRVEALERFVRGFRMLLDRPEGTVLHVGHSLPIRYVLSAALEEDPRPVMGLVEYAHPYTLDADAFARAVARLERWIGAPAW
jgi:broad specificity phosphatase PhoE